MTLSRVIAFATVSWLAACVGNATVRPTTVVIVTLDTTRADRLPAYGFESVSTPALDRLARDGVVFDEAMSVAPLTLTAHTSLFTGLYPPHHGVRDNADAPLVASQATLATTLHARGFQTGAFVGSQVLASDRGLARGFDVYDDGGTSGGPAPRRRSAADVVDRALAWLRTTRDAPVLLWVHLYDMHVPQAVPEPYRSRYGGDSYAGAIAFVDSQLARLFDGLGTRLHSSAIVVVGDHGESLGEHGEIEHGIFLYEGPLHVPLMIRAPGVAPRRVFGLVSLVDIAPTVLDLVGAPVTSSDGVNLGPVLRDRAVSSPRVLYAESMYPRRFGWSPLRAVREEHFKLIDAPRPELFDLDHDPFEQHDLSLAQPDRVALMRAELATFETPEDGPGAGDVRAPSPDVRQRLATLGYAMGAGPVDLTLARDPKDYIETFNRVRHQPAR